MQKIEKELLLWDVVQANICNKCGEDCYGEGLPETHISGGYGSSVLGDGNSYSFALCEECLWELFQTFKIKPIEPNNNLALEHYDEWVATGQKEYTEKMRADPNWRERDIKDSRRMIEHRRKEVEEVLKENGYVKKT